MKIIFTNGCFDILHVGHVKLLEYAKSLGDYLIVAGGGGGGDPGRPTSRGREHVAAGSRAVVDERIRPRLAHDQPRGALGGGFVFVREGRCVPRSGRVQPSALRVGGN